MPDLPDYLDKDLISQPAALDSGLAALQRRVASQPSEPIAWVLQVLPTNWRVILLNEYGRAARSANGLGVIETLNRESDGRRWHHVSLSRQSRLPSYEDVHIVRRLFLGDMSECYQVFPPRERWVNTHPYCLHLWACIDAPNGVVLPDFRHQGEI